MIKMMAFMTISFIAGGCAVGSGRTEYIPTDTKHAGLGPNMQDFLNVTEYLASSLVSHRAIADAKTPPLVVIEPLLNQTMFIQDMSMYTSKVRTILIQKGGDRVRFIDRAAMKQIEKEREFKDREDVTGKVKKGLASADYFLRGELQEITTTLDKATSRGYRFVMRLTDADSGVITWEDEREFQKREVRGAFNQ
jgi:PBP1b-binding outer membrane lipoprotein LpoB